jgi:L-seryl-tRNA(Ser) seleniumtransferase
VIARPPRTDQLLSDPRLGDAQRRVGRALVKEAIHAVQQGIRTGEVAAVGAVEAILQRLPSTASSMQPVINATGVILHTNLGRAPLSQAAVAAVIEAAGYVAVEYDASTGRRGPRGVPTRKAALALIPNAEDVLFVNNGAAALVLTMSTLAAGREVLWSRGELVEIGDGFRLRDIVLASGGRIVEVGATNRTSATDFADAIGDETACILRVHASNFAMVGYHGTVSVEDVCGLGVPVVVDVGSGLLQPVALLPDEPDVNSTLAAGAALVIASCDKLLGGPQAGLIAGDAELIHRIRRHPLARAMRVDKLTLAALEATFRAAEVPVRKYLEVDAQSLRRRCESVASKVGADISVVPTVGRVGGGSAPGVELSSWAVSLPGEYAERLRGHVPPVIGRTEDGRCLLDLRCVPQESDVLVVDAVLAAARRSEPAGATGN